MDSALILEITTSQDILPHSDHLQDHEILDILDLEQTQTQQTNLIPFNQKRQMILSTSEYICITLLKMANALTPKTLLYSIYCHTPNNQS